MAHKPSKQSGSTSSAPAQKRRSQKTNPVASPPTKAKKKKNTTTRIQHDENNPDRSNSQVAHHDIEQQTKTNQPSQHREDLTVVGIGASAGGLEALEAFFHALPTDTGMAFVVVTHQMPGRTSYLPNLLKKYTTMRIVQASDRMELSPNTIYVFPPGEDISLMNNRLHVMTTNDTIRRPRLPIDYFFRSMAQDRQDKAIGIVLSGTGSDGTLGCKVIKGEGGVVMIQDPATAKHAGMPQNVAATGLVDFSLPVEDLPRRLVNYSKYGFTIQDPGTPVIESPYMKTLVMLRGYSGLDFSGYKFKTIRRRVQRRMAMHHIDDPATYNQMLAKHPQELAILARELLIGVTTFFRDVDAWNILAERVLPEYLQHKQDQEPFRAWVAGCSSGEEAYSLAIVLQECLSRLNKSWDVKIFATDLDEQNITMARSGIYPEGITADLNPDRLERFFVKEDNHYQIKKAIREMVIFAPQNVLSDPPFSHLDVLCCRNLLIYLENEPQKQLLQLFHHTLKPQGILFLGPSETLGKFTSHFTPLDKKWRIFKRLDGRLLPLGKTRSRSDEDKSHTSDEPVLPTNIQNREAGIAETVQALLAMHYAPPCVLADARGGVAYIHGRTGLFLEPSAGLGYAPQNLFRMAREGLGPILKAALRKAEIHDGPVMRDDVAIKTNGGTRSVQVSVQKIRHPETVRDMFLVTFRARDSPEADSADRSASRHRASTGTAPRKRRSGLEHDLEETKRSLQSTIEELELLNEELKSANEEAHSMNEELQSTNEELEASKEEMQSLNEELQTVNLELQGKIDELSHVHDDLQNIFNSTEIAVLFLDKSLHIKRFTPQTKDIFHLINSDIGRPIADLVSRLKLNTVVEDAQTVLKTLSPKESDVQTKDGQWYKIRIHPYRTTKDVVDGVIITFSDVTAPITAKKNEQERAAKLLAIIEASRDAIIGYSREGDILGWNKAAERTYGFSEDEALGHSISFITPADHREEMISIHQRITDGESIESFWTIRQRKDGTRLKIQLSISPIKDRDDRIVGFSTIHYQGEQISEPNA